MKAYFQLQFTMTNRKLADMGLAPVLGYLLLLIGFAGSSFLLFAKTAFAPYLYVLVALSLALKLSHVRRNDFLRSCFSRPDYYKLRVLENWIVAFPFALFLLYKMLLLPVLILFPGAGLLALINLNNHSGFTIPTPFYKRPFEFIAGFRTTFYLYGFACFLTVMAIFANNFELGIFALLLVFLITLTYYFKPENEFFVWIFNLTPRQFLAEKIKTALIFSSVLTTPIFLGLSLFFLNQIEILLIFQLLGYAFLIAIILAKYAAYPGPVSLPQAFLLATCLYFPPLLIGIIPFFYMKSVKRLNQFLA